MVLHEDNLRMAFKFQLIWKQTWRNLSIFHLLQTTIFWHLTTLQSFQTLLLYLVFLYHMQKCDSASDMQGLRREHAFIKKLILHTDTTQFLISHLSNISKDTTYCTLNFKTSVSNGSTLRVITACKIFIFTSQRQKHHDMWHYITNCAHCSRVTCFFKVLPPELFTQQLPRTTSSLPGAYSTAWVFSQADTRLIHSLTSSW